MVIEAPRAADPAVTARLDTLRTRQDDLRTLLETLQETLVVTKDQLFAAQERAREADALREEVRHLRSRLRVVPLGVEAPKKRADNSVALSTIPELPEGSRRETAVPAVASWPDDAREAGQHDLHESGTEGMHPTSDLQEYVTLAEEMAADYDRAQAQIAALRAQEEEWLVEVSQLESRLSDEAARHAEEVANHTEEQRVQAEAIAQLDAECRVLREQLAEEQTLTQTLRGEVLGLQRQMAAAPRATGDGALHGATDHVPVESHHGGPGGQPHGGDGALRGIESLVPALVAALTAARAAEPGPVGVPLDQVTDALSATIGAALDPLAHSVQRLADSLDHFTTARQEGVAIFPSVAATVNGASRDAAQREEEPPGSEGPPDTDDGRWHAILPDSSCPEDGPEEGAQPSTTSLPNDAPENGRRDEALPVGPLQKATATSGEDHVTLAVQEIPHQGVGDAASGEDAPGPSVEEVGQPWEDLFTSVEHAWIAGREVGDQHERYHFLAIRSRLGNAVPATRDEGVFLADLSKVQARMGDDFSYCLLDGALQQLHHPTLNPLLLVTKMAALKSRKRHHVWHGPRS